MMERMEAKEDKANTNGKNKNLTSHSMNVKVIFLWYMKLCAV